MRRYDAPFVVPVASDERQGPKFIILLFLAILYVPLIVAGLFLGQWGFCLLWSVLGAIAILWVCLRNLLSLRFVMNHAFINESFVRLLALLAGLVLLMLPVALYSGTHPGHTGDTVQGHWPTTSLSALYSAAQTICLNLSPSDWISDARSLGDFPEILYSAHAFLLIAFTLGIPFAAVFAALDAFYSGVADIRIKLWSWQKTHGREPGEIYVFHELNPQGTALASSIVETRKDHGPLIIFAGFNDADPNGVDILVSDLLHRAHGKASILFTSLPTEIIPDKLSKRALETCAIHYFSIADDGASNLRTSGLLWNIVFEQLWNETWRIWHTAFSKEYPDLGPGDYGKLCQSIAEAIVARAMGASSTDTREADGGRASFNLDPAAFDSLLRMGARLGIHCMYTNPKDVALLDGILGRNVESITSHLTEECQGHRSEIADGIRELASRLRELVDLHFASQSEMAIQTLFEHHPLIEVLDPIDLANTASDNQTSTPVLREQQLTVLIVGCGSYGIEALKTAFWLGRIAGTQLKIVVVDKADVAEKMERLYLNCPGLMTERTYREDGLGPRRGVWSITTRHATPTVRFVEADVFGSEMRALLAGHKVHAKYYTDDATPTLAEGLEAVLDDNDHLYCLVCLSDEELGLDAAFDLQRDLAERKMRAWREDEADVPVAGRRDSLVPIAVRVSNDYTAEALGEGGPQHGLRDYGFPLYTFGSLTDTFSLGFMNSDRLRIQAIQVCAIDARARHERPTFHKAEMDYHGLDELSRYQLRSFALPIPHKLWTLGITPGEIDAEGFWHLLRPSTADEDRKATKSHVDQLFWNGLGVTDEQVPLTRGGHRQGSAGAFSVDEDREFRSRWPLLSYMGDLEHVRWRALLRALGWRDTLALIEDSDPAASSTERLEQIRQRLPFLEGVSNTDLRLHYFLCDDLDELARRGQDCGRHPFSYGRLVLWYSIDILNGTVAERPRESSGND